MAPKFLLIALVIIGVAVLAFYYATSPSTICPPATIDHFVNRNITPFIYTHEDLPGHVFFVPLAPFRKVRIATTNPESVDYIGLSYNVTAVIAEYSSPATAQTVFSLNISPQRQVSSPTRHIETISIDGYEVYRVKMSTGAAVFQEYIWLWRNYIFYLSGLDHANIQRTVNWIVSQQNRYDGCKIQ